MGRSHSKTRSAARRLSPWERIGLGVERMLGTTSSPPIEGSRSWIPEVRVVDRAREVLLRLVSPDLDPRKIRIQLSGRVLTLSAADVDGAPDRGGYRAFRRSILLPENIDWRHISARISGHILSIRIRKSPAPAGSSGMRKVRDLMTRDVRTVTPETPIVEAAALLRAFDIGSVPVCRDRKVVGILTDRDIAIRVTAQKRDPTVVTAGDVMTPNPVTCSEDGDLSDAERIMRDEQVRRLPVVDSNGLLVGYLALAKIARSDNALRSGQVLQGVSEPGKAGVRQPSGN